MMPCFYKVPLEEIRKVAEVVCDETEKTLKHRVNEQGFKMDGGPSNKVVVIAKR